MKKRNKKFTLIEMVVVVAVLGILASIIVPNIGNFKEKSLQTALNKDIQNLQTVSDMYSLDHHGLFPTIQQPKPDMSESIDFTSLYPDYERNLPRQNAYYWIDINGTVWGSLTDAPQGVVKNEEGTLDWSTVPDASSYQVFEVVNRSASSAAIDSRVSYIPYGKPTVETEMVVESGKIYSVSAIDRNGNLSAPIGTERYTGYVDTLKAAVTGEKTDFNRKPVARFNITPNKDLDTITPVTWDTSRSFDPDYDQIVKKEWKVNGVVSSTPPNLFTKVGDNIVELRIQDSAGNWSEPYSQTFAVKKGNHKPTASITISPSTTLYTLTNISFNYSNFTDVDGDTFAGVEWLLDDVAKTNPNGIITKVGSHTIKMRVKDSQGLWGDWVSKTFNVYDPPSSSSSKSCSFGNYSDTCHYVLEHVKNTPVTLTFKATTYNKVIYSDQGGYLVVRGSKSGVLLSKSISSFTDTYQISFTPRDDEQITIDVSPRSSGTSVSLTFSYSYYSM